MADIIVREAVAAEYAAIDEMLATIYLNEGFIPAGQRVSESAAKRSARAALLVAVDAESGTLLGSATVVTRAGPAVRISKPGEAEIRLLAVAPVARGRGAGALLTRACTDRAREDRCTRVVLATLPTMSEAQRLYGRLGFVRAPSRDHAGPAGAPMLVYELAL